MAGCGSPCPPSGREHPIQIAPMIDVSHRDFRQFMRLLTSRAQLWTEMVKDEAITHSLGDGHKLEQLIGLDRGKEHPVVFQLGGSDPATLAQAAEVVERWGYDEVNLNVGCPSDRVACRGAFGAALMRHPTLVRDCVHQMQRRVQIPVTVKTRLGVDEDDSWEFARRFVAEVSASGCTHFIIHARKAWLKGLSPAQNRSIPPLNYGRVRRLCSTFPHLRFSLNGGVRDLETAAELLGSGAPSNLAGVMLGRAAMDTPALFHACDETFYECEPPRTATGGRRGVFAAYADYLAQRYPAETARAGLVSAALRPCHSLLAGLPGARLFARSIEDSLRGAGRRAAGTAATRPAAACDDDPSCVAAVLRAATAAVDEQHPGVLDLPLSCTSVGAPWLRFQRDLGEAAPQRAAALRAARSEAHQGELRLCAAAPVALRALCRTPCARWRCAAAAQPSAPLPVRPPRDLHGWWEEEAPQLPARSGAHPDAPPCLLHPLPPPGGGCGG
eukprot:TRINITY_DN25351_c0_g1_i1.p1 TRINITY_DN25351_c0_g1~~TRINITY_DN25351_c0_g1_i1.p1  ORF type:complete len:520 (+),score=83.03 TRINITY_DN25351_c0_g1_i1:63-1562(+)